MNNLAQKAREEIDKYLYSKDEGDRVLFWKLYNNVYGEYFNNAYKCAVMAGWSEKKAKYITKLSWFDGEVRRKKMRKDAENIISEYCNSAEPMTKEDINIMRLRQDTAKFILDRLDKKNYSPRRELTGKGGKDLIPNPILGSITKENVPTDNSSQ